MAKVYVEVVFMQGEDANEALNVLDEQGEAAAIDHLAQWDNGDEGETRGTPSAGSQDVTYRDGRYLLTYNRALGYIGLERIESANRHVSYYYRDDDDNTRSWEDGGITTPDYYDEPDERDVVGGL